MTIGYLVSHPPYFILTEEDELPNGPALEAFSDVAYACIDAGFAGMGAVETPIDSKRSAFLWRFDMKTPEGRLLHTLLQWALKGVIPPPTEKVLQAIRGAHGH